MQAGRVPRRNASSGITLLPRKVMEDTIQTVISFTNCSREEAVGTLAIYGGDILKTLDALFQKPVVSGEKHIPVAPKADTGQDQEQKERCAAGRDLMDKLTFVFSGAHRKTLEQTPPASVESGGSEPDQVSQSAPLTTSPRSDSPGQTTQLYPQSGAPQ